MLNSAQQTIDNGNTLIASQKKLNDKLAEESAAKSNLITDLKALNQQNQNVCDAEKIALNNDIIFLKTQSKKDSRKSFWKGVKIGGLSVVVLGAIALIAVSQ